MQTKFIKIGLMGSMLLSTAISSIAYAAAPVVNTTIQLEKTGSEPFDAGSWDGNLATAGTDSTVDNNIVRMQDSVTYRVEVSVNDANVDNLVSTVLLPDGKQKWIEIPSGCKTDANEVSPVSAISADGYTLTCNVGSAIEGTTRVFFPAAKVVSYNTVTDKPVLNAEHTIARVTATAPGANEAAAGDTDAIITAGFKLDTTKTMKVPGLHKTTGAPLYHAVEAAGPDGEKGILLEYKIKVRYGNGSMIMDSDENTYLRDINLVDHFTDDNSNNNGALSSGGKLYTWGEDGNAGACSLDGDHGATASVLCAQNNNPVKDSISPVINGTGQADGVNDPNIDIALKDIDVRDPDGDSNLVEMNINIWFEEETELNNHQGCADGGTCQNFTLNSVSFNDNGTFKGFNPKSTEDADENNLENYNGAGEPYPNEIDFPMIKTHKGSWGAYKLFRGFKGDNYDNWTEDLKVAPGQLIQYATAIADHRKDYDKRNGQHCDKIDTTQFEFMGLYDPDSGEDTILDNSFGPKMKFNPSLHIYGGGIGYWDGHHNLPNQFTTLYTDIPVGDSAALPESDWLKTLRDSTCNDDVDGDGVVRIKLADGSIVDKTISGAPVADGGPIDWYEQTGYEAAGIPADMGAVTRVRSEYRADETLFEQLEPGYTYTSSHSEFNLKVKPDAAGYGAGKYLPNYGTERRSVGETVDGFTNWYEFSNADSIDPASITFAKDYTRADRVQLVASSIAIGKVTEPKGIKVVRAGDLVDFIITPQVIGIWGDDKTAKVVDTIPAKTSYVPGTEKFSVDGGATWMDYNAYLNSNPDVTLTSAANADLNALAWDFDDIDSDVLKSEKLPLIKYTVLIDETVTQGTFTNTAEMKSDIDNKGGTAWIKAPYALTVFPDYGLDLVKRNQKDVYQTNSPFEFELIYKNLGGENYGQSAFIDILPHNTDGAGNSGGLGSAREPATTFNGTYKVTKLTGTNGEKFFATDAAPTTIPQDPCHEDNLAAGYVPVAGDFCYNLYISENTAGVPVKLTNTFVGGAAAGTGVIEWKECAGGDPAACGDLDPEAITAIQFTIPTLPKSAGGKVAKIELTPTGNKGGTPDIDADSNVTAASTGDVYTNTFGGRVPEISLVVISNDVSVTVVSGSIGDYVWIDQNGDGVQDADEAPIPNVTLKLLDGEGNPIFVDANGGIVPAGTDGAVEYKTQTDDQGKYLFDNLPAGNYQVEVDSTTLPAGVEQTFDADGKATANISAVTLAPVTDPITGNITDIEDKDDQDFGYKMLASLGNFVWDDLNHDGIQDAGEAGVGGVTVTLYDDAGLAVGQTNTKPDGSYNFPGLAPGTYSVGFSNFPAGYELTTAGQGDAATGSDADPVTGRTAPVTLVAGENNPNIDAGLFKPASLGNFVWNDKNNDGIQDADEVGIDGVEVTLYDADGNVVKTITTADGGAYNFDGLLPGTYSVGFVTPDEFEITKKTIGDDQKDSNIDAQGKTTPVTLTSGENNTSIDAGYYRPAKIGDTIWHDKNNDGVVDDGEALAGVKVTLTLPDGTTKEATTGENGKYLFEGLPAGDYTVTVDETTLPELLRGENTQDPDGGNDSTSVVTLDGTGDNLDQDFAYVALGSIGDTVWNDVNHNGQQDEGDLPLGGLTVTLTPPADIDLGNGLGQPITTETDGDGKYLFPNLPAGDYSVVVTPPEGLANTIDPDGGFDSSSAVTLAEGEDNLDQDFAFSEVGNISGKVEADADGDDATDDDRTPIAGVIMRLLDGNGQPVLDADGNPITTVTDADGNYLFRNLPIGDYQVAQEQPAGYDSVSDAGANDPENMIEAITVTGGKTAVANNFVEKVNPSAIPTLSEWALLMLMMLLGFVGYRQAGTRGRGRVGF